MIFVAIVSSVVALGFAVAFVFSVRRLRHRTLERDAYRQLVHLQERPASGSRPDLRIVKVLALLLIPLEWVRDKFAEHPARLASVTGGLAAVSTIVALFSLAPNDPDRSAQSTQNTPPASAAPSRPSAPALMPTAGEASQPRMSVEQDVSDVAVASSLVETSRQEPAEPKGSGASSSEEAPPPNEMRSSQPPGRPPGDPDVEPRVPDDEQGSPELGGSPRRCLVELHSKPLPDLSVCEVEVSVGD